jgi:hypothetical protein
LDYKTPFHRSAQQPGRRAPNHQKKIIDVAALDPRSVLFLALGISLLTGACDSDESTVTEPAPPLFATAGATIASLALSPDPGSVAPGGRLQFSLQASWSDGSTTVPPVYWLTSGGAMTTDGVYLAPSTSGTYRVMAVAKDLSKADTVMVTVGSTSSTKTVKSLNVSPDPVTLQPGQTKQFSSLVTFSDGTTSSSGVSWSATGGSVSSSGLYTAGTSTGTYRVVAAASGSTVKDTAAVTISTAKVTKLVVSPGSASLTTGGSQQFSATATWSDGVSRAVTLAWSATGGTISSSGLYKAGLTTGTYHVIVGCNGCTVKDTASVSLTLASSSSSSLSSFTISPSSVTLDIGEVYQFSALAKKTDGSTVSASSLSWSASGGSVTSTGLYRAPRTAGTYSVNAKYTDGTTISSAVTVKVPSGPYFSDNFNSCTLNKSGNSYGFYWASTGGGTSTEVPRVVSSLGRSGSCALRFTYSAGPSGDDGWSEQRFKFGKKLSEVYMRWYQYFPSGSDSPSRGPKYYHRNDTGPDNNKFLRLWDEDYTNYKLKLGLGFLPKSYGDSHIMAEYGTNHEGVGPRGSDYDQDGITNSRRGRWIKIDFHMRLATAANNDGVIEMWVDGVKTISNTSLPMYPDGGLGNYVRNGYIMGWSNSGFNSTTNIYVDDVVISGVPIP